MNRRNSHDNDVIRLVSTGSDHSIMNDSMNAIIIINSRVNDNTVGMLS